MSFIGEQDFRQTLKTYEGVCKECVKFNPTTKSDSTIAESLVTLLQTHKDNFNENDLPALRLATRYISWCKLPEEIVVSVNNIYKSLFRKDAQGLLAFPGEDLIEFMVPDFNQYLNLRLVSSYFCDALPIEKCWRHLDQNNLSSRLTKILESVRHDAPDTVHAIFHNFLLNGSLELQRVFWTKEYSMERSGAISSLADKSFTSVTKVAYRGDIAPLYKIIKNSPDLKELHIDSITYSEETPLLFSEILACKNLQVFSYPRNIDFEPLNKLAETPSIKELHVRLTGKTLSNLSQKAANSIKSVVLVEEKTDQNRELLLQKLPKAATYKFVEDTWRL